MRTEAGPRDKAGPVHPDVSVCQPGPRVGSRAKKQALPTPPGALKLCVKQVQAAGLEFRVSVGCWLSCSTRELAGLALCWSRTVVKTGPPSNHKSKGGGSLGHELATSCTGAEAQVLPSTPGPQFRHPLMSSCSLPAASCFSILKNIPRNGFEASALHIPCSI